MNILSNETYVEFLQLNKDIRELTMKVNAPRWFEKQGSSLEENKKTLTEKVVRLKMVIKQLNLDGISSEQLILLSLGVEVNPEECTLTLLEELNGLDVQFIVLNGYYSHEDDGDKLHQHTVATKTLFDKGFNETYKGELKDNEDTFNGVLFDEDNHPLAEWYLNGKEKYLKISL